MKKIFLSFIQAAQSSNQTFEDIARKYLQSNGLLQSAVKDYIIRAGMVPDVGIVEQARQAGFLIQAEAGDQMQAYLNLEPGFIPSRYRKLNFYSFSNDYPAAFIACLLLSLEKKPVSNFLFLKAEQTKKIKDAGNQAVNWVKETVSNAGKDLKDLAGKAATLGKKVTLAAPRGAFLLLVRFNVFNFARRLNAGIEKNRTKIKNDWENVLGGDFAQLVSAVNLGKKESPVLPGKSSTLDPASITASIAAATPVIAQVTATLAAVGVAVDSAIDIKDKIVDETGKTIEDTNKLKSEAEKMLPERGNVNTPWGGISWGLTNNKADIIKIVIGAVVVVSLFYLIRKK